jgi:hypothetical protein
MSLDWVGDPVNVDSGDIFESLLEIVQNDKFYCMSAFDEFMSQSTDGISDVSQTFRRIFPAK